MAPASRVIPDDQAMAQFGEDPFVLVEGMGCASATPTVASISTAWPESSSRVGHGNEGPIEAAAAQARRLVALGRAYGKLGIRSRAELAAALGPHPALAA